MVTCMDLADKFHSLEGTLIGEKKKNLYSLLRITSAAPDIHNLTFALQTIKPTTYLETLLWIEILIYFRRTKELFEVLKSGNERLISKIIQQKWFFEEAFKTVTGDKFVNEICPCLSFTIRMKILKKISQSLSQEQVDDIFNSVLQKYGLFIAKTILSSCSSNIIEEIVKNNNITLESSQLIRIFNKNPKVLETYISEYKNKNKTNLNDKKLFEYIAKKDVMFYWNLKENYQIDFSLGKRSTKKFIIHKRTDIIENPKEFQKSLQWRSVTRKLQSDYKKVFLKLFPDNPNSRDLIKLLKFYPKKYKYNLFIETFRTVYNDEIWNHLHWINDQLLPIMPDEVKAKWAEIQFKTSNHSKFLKYLPVTKSIPLLKEKINLTSNIVDREYYLITLIDCCTTTNDMMAYEEVLKYICVRHKNDDPIIRSTILNTISESNLTNFNENHWSCINEIITVQRMKNYDIGNENLRTGYIEFLFNNGKSYQKELLQFFKDNQYNRFLLSVNNSELERAVLCFAIDVIPQIAEDEEFVYRKHAQHITDITNFNKKHPDLSIDILSYPVLIKSIKMILQNKKKYTLKGIYNLTSNLLFTSNRTNVENEILEVVKQYYSRFSKNYLHNVIMELFLKVERTDFENALLKVLWEPNRRDKYSWVMKYQPQVILDNFDGFRRIIPQLNKKNLYTIKKYSHLKFDEKCINFLKTLDYCKSRNWITKPLSILMDPEEYLKYIERFIPTSKKMTLRNQDELYNFQCCIGRDLKHIRSPIVIPILLKWCRGDYLRTTLPALWTIFYRMPENELLPLIDYLYDQPISVRKHAVFLACNILNQKKVFEILSSTDTNKSMRKHLLSSTYKVFVKNPTDEYFELVKIFIGYVDKSDWESLYNLADIDKIPRKYKNSYIEAVMSLYDEVEKHGVSVDDYRSNLLSLLRKDDVSDLPTDFCKRNIEKHFLKSTNILNFVIMFLEKLDNQQENFQFISKLVCNSDDELVCNFFYNFFYRVKEMTNVNTDFIRYFTEMFEKIFNVIDSFDEYVLNRLIDIRRQITESFIENFALKVVKFGEELEIFVGQFILSRYVGLVYKSLGSFVKNKFAFYKSMLDRKVSVSTYLMVLQFLECSKPSELEERECYNSIIEVLRNVTDTNVRLYFNIYLKSLRNRK